MGKTFYFLWEVSLMENLQANLNDFMIKVASFISAFGEELAMVFILGFFYWIWDKEIGFKVAMNISITDILFPLLKNITLRRRPYMDNENIKCLKLVDKDHDAMDIVAQGYSFPSGHSANSAAAFSSIALFLKKKIFTIIAIVLPFLVGISRVMLGAHYPTDVLVGWIMGYSVVLLTPLISKKFENERKFYYILFFIFTLGAIYVRSNDYYTSMGIMLGTLLGSGFEKKYVHFKNTRNILTIVLRLFGGVVIFLGLNVLFKMPFSEEFLSEPSFLQFGFRFIRYTILLFVESGIYPMLFGKIVKEKKK